MQQRPLWFASDFWNTVTSCASSAVGKVSKSYKGNVNDADCFLTGLKQYPGLKQVELNTASQYYAFDYWTGIDCAGFVQRIVMAGKKLALPGLLCKIPDLMDKDINPVNHLDDGGILAQQFFTDSARTAYWIKPGNDEDSVKLQKKLRKGDLVRYGATHISTICSDKPSCDNSSCTYEIIHASGDDELCYKQDDDTLPNQCSFNRKVVRNEIKDKLTSTTLKMPTGFGRIKLWD